MFSMWSFNYDFDHSKYHWQVKIINIMKFNAENMNALRLNLIGLGLGGC